MARSGEFRRRRICRASFEKKFGGGGGGLKLFAPKSFVGKHFVGHIHLRAISEVNKGRWVYEGSELKAIWKKLRTTLTFH